MSRAFAQGDSVQLRIDYSIGTFNWSLLATSLCASPAVATGSIDLRLQYSGLARHHLDSVRTDNIYIVIDSQKQEIALSMLSFGSVPTCSGHSCMTYLNNCGVSFIRIPYTTDSEGSIHACGDYDGTAHAVYGGVFVSDCRDPLSTSMGDSSWNINGNPCLSIAIIPKATIRDHSKVLLTMVLRNKQMFVTSDNGGTLVINDLIGRTIDRRSIPVASVDYPIAFQSLPPGCYFARLSGANGASEVVKFVVAP